MPSSPNYRRNYVEEHKTAIARGEQGTGHDGEGAKRARFRRAAIKAGAVKKGQDLDHRIPLSKGGANTLANARAEAPGVNRSFARNKDGSMVSNKPTAQELKKLGRKHLPKVT